MPLRCRDNECPVFDECWGEADICWEDARAVGARIAGGPCPWTAEDLRREAQRHRRVAEALEKAAEMRQREEARG